MCDCSGARAVGLVASPSSAAATFALIWAKRLGSRRSTARSAVATWPVSAIVSSDKRRAHSRIWRAPAWWWIVSANATVSVRLRGRRPGVGGTRIDIHSSRRGGRGADGRYHGSARAANEVSWCDVVLRPFSDSIADSCANAPKANHREDKPPTHTGCRHLIAAQALHPQTLSLRARVGMRTLLSGVWVAICRGPSRACEKSRWGLPRGSVRCKRNTADVGAGPGAG